MARSGLEFRWSLAAALALGLALRIWFVLHAGRVDGDGLLYGDIAQNLIHRGVYGFSTDFGPPRPTLIRLPGYPLFLAACFRLFGVERYTAVMGLQVVADLLTCLLIGALSGRLFGRRAGFASVWLAALCPFTACYVASVLSETLTLLCIAAAFYCLERWGNTGAGFSRWLWGVAIALAYAVLLRPEQGLLAAAVVPTMLWMAWHDRLQQQNIRQAISPVLLAAFCVVLPLVPWGIRNYRVLHVIQPLAPRYANDPGEQVPLGFFRWYRTWAIDFYSTETIYWNYGGQAVQISDLPTRAFDSNQQYARTAALFDAYNLTVRSNPNLDAVFGELAAKRIAANPIRYYIALPMARLINMIFRPRTETLPIPLEWWKGGEHPRQTLIAFALGAINLAYLALAGAGVWLWSRARPPGGQASGALIVAMIASILLRCALLLTIDNSEPRYTLEFFPVLIVFAGACFTQSKRLFAREDAA